MNTAIGRSRVSNPTLLIGKWTVQIIYLLKDRPHRHRDLQRRLGAISQRMLTRTLRNLAAWGLIVRTVIRSKPVAVEYALTSMGRSFVVPVNAMCRWLNRNRSGIRASIHLPYV
jgi:DNA-binding HxlR family transcriptional regulator